MSAAAFSNSKFLRKGWGSRKDREAVEEQKASAKRAAQASSAPAALITLGALAGYWGVKATLQGYQRWRRHCLRRLVMRVCPALDQLGVDYWCDFGTLLGAHREKDIILHDNDADIVVLNPDWEVLAAQLRPLLPNWRVYFVQPSEDRSIRWLRVSCAVGVLDLYGGYHKPGRPQVEIPQGHGDLCDVAAQHIFPLARAHFRGVSVSVPGDVHSVLVHRYGADFMVPRYMDKGRDSVEQGKLYARLLGALGSAGLRV